MSNLKAGMKSGIAVKHGHRTGVTTSEVWRDLTVDVTYSDGVIGEDVDANELEPIALDTECQFCGRPALISASFASCGDSFCHLIGTSIFAAVAA